MRGLPIRGCLAFLVAQVVLATGPRAVQTGDVLLVMVSTSPDCANPSIRKQLYYLDAGASPCVGIILPTMFEGQYNPGWNTEAFPIANGPPGKRTALELRPTCLMR